MKLEIFWEDHKDVLTLQTGNYRVGRTDATEITLSWPKVSKHHAEIRVEGDRLFVRDLESRNGTRVDGIRVGGSEVEVTRDATISFGGAMMRQQSQVEEETKSLFSSGEVAADMTHGLADAFSEEALARIVNQSAELFELLSADGSAEALEKSACRFVSTCVTASRVVMLVDNGEGTQLRTGARWSENDDESARLQLSTSIIAAVIKDRASLLVSDPNKDFRFESRQSIIAANVRSAMAAPLFDNERVRGIIYVDTNDQNIKYTREDLQVLTSIANAVAVKLRNIGYESEMKTAAAIQRQMLPREMPTFDRFEAVAQQVMCRAVGGDLYHAVSRPNGRTLFALGDVAGKGTPAALAMGATMVLIPTLADSGLDITEIASRISKRLFDVLTPEQFVTLFFVELDPESNTLHCVNCGHESPLILRRDRTFDAIKASGLPVGMVAEPTYSIRNAVLEPGETLVVFSDGIPEATARGDSFLGIDKMKSVLLDNIDSPLTELKSELFASVEQFLEGTPPSDDVTLLALRRSR